MKLRIIPAAFFFTALLARGSVVYVSQGGAGSQSGADADDAHSLAWINTPANFPSSGSTIRLEGTFTSPLVVAGSGAQGRPTTIVFDSGANFTNPCWPYGTQSGGGAIQPNGSSWIIVDGGANGFIQNTNCGTGKPNTSTSGIAGRASHWVIRNLTITNLYQRSSYVDFPSGSQGGNGIYLLGNDLTVTNCNVSDALGLVTFQPWNDPVNTNYNIVGNRLLNGNHFVGFSLPENTVISNVTIAGNLFDHADVWDGGGGGNNLHMDYIIIIDGGVLLRNAYVSHTCINNNTWGANYMANLDVITNYPGWGRQSAGVFTNGTDSATHGQTAIVATYFNGQAAENRNVFIFDNLALSHTNETWGNPPIAAAGTNVWLVNNTCVGLEGNAVPCGGAFMAGGSSVYAYNNITFPGYGVVLTGITTSRVDGGNNSANDLFILTNYLKSCWSDFNASTVDSGGMCRFGYGVGSSIAGSTPFNTLSLNTLKFWQTYINNEWGWRAPIWNTAHADPHSYTHPVTFGVDYTPLSGGPAAGSGSNLTAVAVAYGVPLTNDFKGNVRSASGNWDGGYIRITSGNGGQAGEVPPLFTR